MASKKTRFLAAYTHEGELHTNTRNSTHNYKFAAVVRWSDGSITVGAKWSATEAGARSCLTGEQTKRGAVVLAVVPVVPQPDLTAAEQMFGSLLPRPPKEA